jgi:hypothetical protein
MIAAPSPQGRRILVATVTGEAGSRIQRWRDEHDPVEARRLPPHTTLCYWAPAVDPTAVERQVRYAFAAGIDLRLGAVHVFENQERTLYVGVEDAAPLDEARRRLHDGRHVELPGFDPWTWHVTCVRRSRGRDLQALLDAAAVLGTLGPWRLQRVLYMELRGDRYENLAAWDLDQAPAGSTR